MNAESVVLRAVKRIRSWPAVNRPATSLARSLARAFSFQPEFLPRHFHRVGTVSCEMPDGNTIRLWSRGDDWVSNRLFWFGWKGYEPETVPVFAALAAEAATTIDIGAYVGFYSLLAGRCNPRGKVHAFEPMPAIFSRLEQNLRLNELSNVEAHRLAVGAAAGTSRFYFLPETELPTSSSLSRSFTSSIAELSERDVTVTTVDDFVLERSISRLDLLKIDTETTEADVLRGARSVLMRDRPHIVCEVLAVPNTSRSVEEGLKGLQYNYFLLTPEGPQPRDHIEPHPEYLNYLFTALDSSALQSRISQWAGR